MLMILGALSRPGLLRAIALHNVHVLHAAGLAGVLLHHLVHLLHHLVHLLHHLAAGALTAGRIDAVASVLSASRSLMLLMRRRRLGGGGGLAMLMRRRCRLCQGCGRGAESEYGHRHESSYACHFRSSGLWSHFQRRPAEAI
jgi:hypothetical protein